MASCSGGGESGGLLGGSVTPGGREELKSQFSTREGVYRLLASLELSRSSRPLPLPYGTMSTAPSPSGPSHPLRISFVTITNPPESKHLAKDVLQEEDDGDPESGHDPLDLIPSETEPMDRTNTRFCFNLGKELFVYPFQGSRKISDLLKPLDKRVYKGTFPTCHEFNPLLATAESLSLLIGFSGGQIQLVEPISKEVNKLYNEDRMIDKTRVTCIRWVFGSQSQFLVSHGSGCLYLYNIELSSGTTAPAYVTVKSGCGWAVANGKSKAPRNPLTKWTLGQGAINEFAFSPCGLFLATVSQDGFLRIFRYEKYELVGVTRSYFGGLLCVCWSPDSKYVCVGGEDDLLTIWSFNEKRVVARGQGHRSWVSVVAFDPYTTTYGESEENEDMSSSLSVSQRYDLCSCDLNHLSPSCPHHRLTNHNHNHSRLSPRISESATTRLSVSETSNTRIPACYRLGSVSQDTQLCLWDITEDILKQPFGKSRPTTSGTPRIHSDSSSSTPHAQLNGNTSPKALSSSTSLGLSQVKGQIKNIEKSENGPTVNSSSSGHNQSILSLRFGVLGFGDKNIGNSEKDKGSKEHRRNFSLGSKWERNGGNSRQSVVNSVSVKKESLVEEGGKVIGTEACPRLDECPLLEPLICKKISHERLTALVFREESILTVCQDGIICTWSRPVEESRRPKRDPQEDIFKRFYTKGQEIEPL